MDQGQDKLEVAKRILEALKKFVDDDERDQVHVFESSAGNLRAIVGSRKFAGMSPVERQETIWKFLNDELEREVLNRLFGVHAKDNAEYAADELRYGASATVNAFIRGAANIEEGEVENE